MSLGCCLIVLGRFHRWRRRPLQNRPQIPDVGFREELKAAGMSDGCSTYIIQLTYNLNLLPSPSWARVEEERGYPCLQRLSQKVTM